jgi:hypothetical protein
MSRILKDNGVFYQRPLVEMPCLKSEKTEKELKEREGFLK